MNQSQLPYQYICIEGNIGSGKTTLAKMLTRDFKADLILEEFSDNPFLPFFYQDPERYGFPVELFFMTERQKQLQKHLINRSLFQDLIIADYHFIKTALFARKNLTTEEYRLFMRLFKILNASFPKPDLIVYLHRSIDKLLEYIQIRGREYELNMSRDYLENIQNSYFEYFRSEQDFPILIIDCEHIDFQNPVHYQEISSLLTEHYPSGIHRVSLVRS